MKKILTIFASAAIGIMANAEITPTDNGAKITVDSLTTEVIVCSPSQVRVLKYYGNRPETANCPTNRELKRVAAKGKYKIDAGEYYVALNEKDGNVSFWDHEGVLIMAEQHRTASLTPLPGENGRYTVKQDFQFGRAAVDSILCPAAKTPVNLKGSLTEFGKTSEALPSPYVTTEKGFGILWNSPAPGQVDDTPERPVKKAGDVTFTSDNAPAIDYFFLYPAPADPLPLNGCCRK